jgi:Predicted NAD/FAD-binding protein
MMGFPSNHVRLNTRVTRLISERDGRVRLHTHSGKSEVFDHVILATHGDQAYQIIRDSATDEEHEILRHFLTSKNVAVLHSDISLMPTSRKAWSAWNYLAKSSSPNLKKQTGNITQVCLTYDMNALQHIPRNIFGKVLVTINPLHEPDPTTVQGRYIYRHPLYTPAAVKAQRRLNEIQNKRGISYAGAWTGYGFHEDAFSSGLKVAVEHLGASIPFEWRDSMFLRGKKPRLTIGEWLMKMLILLIQLFVISVFDKLVGPFTGSWNQERDTKVLYRRTARKRVDL